jgi:hypothetical protein
MNAWRTWKMIEERMRNAIIVRAGASGKSRYNYVGATTTKSQSKEDLLKSSKEKDAERMRQIAEYNAIRDAYFSRNCVE